MNSSRKTYRETQLEKQILDLKAENARLKDCVLLQQKIIEKQQKQKQTIEKSYKKSLEENPYHTSRLARTKNSFISEKGSRKLLKCLTSKGFLDYDSLEGQREKNSQRLGSTNDDSRKNTQQQIDESMKKVKQKKKLMTLKDVKELNISVSSVSLYRPPMSATNARRKSYLEKLAEGLTDL